jgi:hypothetical protein
VILQREVVVAAGGQFRAGDFPRDPDVGELACKHRAQLLGELADRVVAPLGSPVEEELFQAFSVLQTTLAIISTC